MPVYIKPWTTSLIINEMEIKMTMTYDFTPMRAAIIKKYSNNKY